MSVVWVICGAGRHVGKTRVATRLCGELPNSVYAKQGHGRAKSGKSQRAGDQYRGKSLKAFLRSREKEYLEQVLQHTKGDKGKAAKALKISLATLYRKLPGGDAESNSAESQD